MWSKFQAPRVHVCLFVGLVVFCCATAPVTSLATDGPASSVRSSLAELQTWLVTSRYGSTWNQYLKNDLLRDTLAQGNRADPQSVAEVLSRYESDVPGLQKPRFIAVRNALQLYLADLTPLPVDELPRVAEKAHTDFASPAAEQVLVAKQNVAQKARQLNRFLAKNPAWAKQWKQFLRWNLLEKQLGSKTPDTAEMTQVMQRLSADYDGLENPHFVQLRRSLRTWIDRSLAANKTAAVQKKIQAYSKELASGLDGYHAGASHWDAMAIGGRVNFLERFGVAPRLTAAVRKHHSHPNLSAYVSAGLISSAMDREIDEVIDIRENILGARIVGEGHITGSLVVDLLPDSQRAVLGLQMTGTTKSQTVGSKRSVRVYANSITKMQANKHVHFSAEGFSSLPTRAEATTETNVTGLSSRRGSRLVERLAWRKVSQSKAQAQRQSSFKAARRLEGRMDKEGEALVANANAKYQTKFRAPLLRKDAFPELFHVQSNDQLVQILMHEAAADQLGAPSAVTPPPPGSDIAVRLHESFVNNMAAHLLGGKVASSNASQQGGESTNFLEKFKKQRQDKLRERRRLEGREEPPAAAATDPENSTEAAWQMRFAKRNPLTVEFREQTLKFVVRGIEFSGLDDQQYKRPMSMWAKYKVEMDKYGGLRLTLLDQGVDPTSVEKGQRFVAADAPLRSKLRVRWKETLEGKNGENKVIEVFPFEFPDPRFKKVGPLAYRRMDLEGGWLTVALDRVVRPEEKQAAASVSSR